MGNKTELWKITNRCKIRAEKEDVLWTIEEQLSKSVFNYHLNQCQKKLTKTSCKVFI